MQCSNKCDFCIWLLHTAYTIDNNDCFLLLLFLIFGSPLDSFICAFTWYLVLLTFLTQCASCRWVCKTHWRCQNKHRIRGKTIAAVDTVHSLESWVQVIFVVVFFFGKSLQHVETPHVIQLTSDHRHHASRRKPQPSIIIQIKWTYWDIRFAVKINYDDRTICLVNSDWCQSVVDIVKFIKLQAYITLKLPSYLLVCTISAQCWYTRFIFDIKLIINVAVA